MIEFKCHCSQPISVDDEQAGGLIQCPRCGRLNDVPTLSDLRNLDADGGFKISELEIVDEPERLHRVTEAFTRNRYDESGEEIDLRPSFEDVERAGVDEIPLSTDEADLVGTPKYDPVTGELVEPIKIKHEPKDHVGEIPMATPVLGYAGRTKSGESVSASLALLMPVNLFAMMFVFFGYVVLGLSIILFSPFAAAMGIRSFWLGVITIVPLLAAHYVNVVSELALEDRDEIPRLLRNMSWGEDIWGPFVQIFISTAICFGPLAVWTSQDFAPTVIQDGVAMLLILGGSLFFPAILLTAATSGSVPNMRPDRVLSVIRAGGASYFIIVACTVFLVFATLIGIAGPSAIPISQIRDGYRATGATWLAIPLVFAHIYFAHYAAWKLGLLYRTRHHKFKWVMQLHEYRNRTRNAPRRPRARQPDARGATPPPTVKSKR